MNIKKFFTAIALIGGTAASLQAQSDSTVMSMKECIEFAAQYNSNIKIARYDEDYGQKQIKEVKGRGLPQINVNGTLEDRIKIPLLIIPNFPGGKIRQGYQYNSSLIGDASQMIYDPSFWVGIKAAKQNTLLYKQKTTQVSEQTAYNIASAYYRVIVLQEQLKLLHSNIYSTQKTLEVTELQFKNGVAKSVDVKRLKVNANNLESQRREIVLNLEQSYNDLKFSMGMPLTQKIGLSDTTLIFNQNEVLNPEANPDNRIEYKMAQTNLRLQELNVKNNRNAYLPTLTAYANYGYVGQGPQFGFYKTSENQWVDYTSSAIGLRLKIPVFDGLQKVARVQQSVIKTKQQRESINLLTQNISLEVSNSWVQYQNTKDRIVAESENVALAEDVYKITQLEFKEGVSTSSDVVEAEVALRRSQNVYSQTLLDLYIARLSYERSVGNLLNYLNSK